MKRNQALWLLLTAVALYYGSVYCQVLPKPFEEMFVGWFDGGRALPFLSQHAWDATYFVAHHGKWIAVVLLVLAAVSFWINREASAVDERAVAVLNAVGYYAARGVLIGLTVLAIFQAHGILIIFLNVDREIRKELGKPVPELESKGR